MAATIIILAIVVVLIYIQHSKAGGELISKRAISFNNGKSTINLSLEDYKEGDETAHYLVHRELFNTEKFKLTGFEDEVMPCVNQEFKVGEDRNALCLTGDVGAHSQNVQFILADKTLGAMDFRQSDGERSPNIVSDLPKIRIIDYNSGGARLAAYGRDYDKNPLVDEVISYYENNEGVFELIK